MRVTRFLWILFTVLLVSPLSATGEEVTNSSLPRISPKAHVPEQEHVGLVGRVVPLLTGYCTDRAVFHWLENVISHQQSTGLPSVQIFQRLYRSGELYAGFWGKSLTLAPARVCSLASFFTAKDLLLDRGEDFERSVLAAGTLAGGVDAVLSCPGENARTRATFGLPRPRGFRENYRGFWALSGRCLGAPIILSGSALLQHNHTLPGVLDNSFGTGFLMGCIAQLFTTPLDGLKNSIMSTPMPYSVSVKRLFIEGGAYRGISLRTLRMGFGSSLILGIIESFQSIFKAK